jgi:hypothetical protein
VGIRLSLGLRFLALEVKYTLSKEGRKEVVLRKCGAIARHGDGGGMIAYDREVVRGIAMLDYIV